MTSLQKQKSISTYKTFAISRKCYFTNKEKQTNKQKVGGVGKYTPRARCLTSLCIISIFYLLLTGHDLLIQRRASFDRTRFCSGLNLENLLFNAYCVGSPGWRG